MVNWLSAHLRQWRRYVRYKYLKILRLKDTPAKVAKGVALGVFLDFLPIPFISLLVAYIIARLARFNAFAAVTTTALFKVAVPFFWTLNVFTGKFILGPGPAPPPHIKTGALLHPELFFHRLGLPFLVGSVINGLLAGLVVYYPVYYLLQRRLAKRSGQKAG
ncbi:MAG: hypothetical protein PWQ91_1790 [Eubacteriales bacterium]|nr:hypothetical protein [Eubacteriales bacterium]